MGDPAALGDHSEFDPADSGDRSYTVRFADDVVFHGGGTGSEI